MCHYDTIGRRGNRRESRGGLVDWGIIKGCSGKTETMSQRNGKTLQYVISRDLVNMCLSESSGTMYESASFSLLALLSDRIRYKSAT